MTRSTKYPPLNWRAGLFLVAAATAAGIVGLLARPDGKQRATFVRTIDGDTIVLKIAGREETIRIAGIDAPEKSQPYGTQAANTTDGLLGAAEYIYVGQGTRDRYGRLVTAVWADKISVGEALTANGMAWHYRQYDDDPKLDVAETAARKRKSGLWADPNPTPPWSWRKQRHQAEEVLTE